MSEPRDEAQTDPAMSALLQEHLSAPPLRREFGRELEARMTAADAECTPRVRSLDSQRRRRLTGRGVVALVAVVAAAAILLVVFLPSPHGTPTATAADMLASMDAAAGGGAHVVRLSIREGVVPAGASPSPSADGVDRYATASHVTPEQLTISTSGDVRWTVTGKHKAVGGRPALTTHDYWTQDARRHETMSLGTVVPDDGNSVLAIERPSWGTNVYETWPVGNIAALASCLRARLAEADPNTPVTETTYLGRPAWHAVFSEHAPGTVDNPEGALFQWRVTVDKATGLLMASDDGYGAQPGEQMSSRLAFWVTRIEVGPQLPNGWQRLSQAGQERIGIYDYGTRFGTPEAVAKRSWPTPVLIPQQVPAGYRLTGVATTYFQGMKQSPKDKSHLIYWSYHHPRKYQWVKTSVDASVQRVVARYRRGFSSFVIDVRPPSDARNLLPGEGLGIRSGGVDVKLTGGYLQGKLASTSISPGDSRGPTLITHSGRYTIGIYGDLTRQELIDVANSLKDTGT